MAKDRVRDPSKAGFQPLRRPSCKEHGTMMREPRPPFEGYGSKAPVQLLCYVPVAIDAIEAGTRSRRRMDHLSLVYLLQAKRLAQDPLEVMLLPLISPP